MKRLLQKIVRWLSKYARPDDEMLVTALVIHVSQLAIPKGEWLELSPMKGCCGNIKLLGNTLPVFEYRMFEKSLMEFILVRVEVALPDRIQFISKIDSQYTQDSKRHNEVVDTQQRYKDVFMTVADHLYRYFPFPRKSAELEYLQSQRITPVDESVDAAWEKNRWAK